MTFKEDFPGLVKNGITLRDIQSSVAAMNKDITTQEAQKIQKDFKKELWYLESFISKFCLDRQKVKEAILRPCKKTYSHGCHDVTCENLVDKEYLLKELGL